MRISRFFSQLCLLTLALTAPLNAQSAFAWKIITQDGIPYIPLEDVRSFYKFTPLKKERGSDAIQSIGNNATRLEFGPGERELKLQGYKLQLSKPYRYSETGDLLLSQEDVSKLLDPILRPVYITNRQEVKTVVIDPGHGGHDVGVRSAAIRESDFTQLIARALAEELRKRHYTVILTQDSNSFRSNQQRAEITRRQDNAIFISLHLNSGRSDTRGIQTYTTAPAAFNEHPVPGNEHDAANIALAFALHSALISQTGATDAGIKRSHFSLLSSLNCPAALVELGYATNEEDCAALNSEAYRQTLCTALADGIDTFAAAMKPDAAMSPPPAAGFTPPATYEESAPKATEHDQQAEEPQKKDPPKPSRRKRRSRR